LYLDMRSLAAHVRLWTRNREVFSRALHWATSLGIFQMMYCETLSWHETFRSSPVIQTFTPYWVEPISQGFYLDDLSISSRLSVCLFRPSVR
jgi:hypothetical protein